VIAALDTIVATSAFYFVLQWSCADYINTPCSKKRKLLIFFE